MQNHKSKATVKNIRLNKEEAERARKSAVGEKLQAREKFIVKAEAAATAFEASYAKLKAINEQHTVLYRSFKEIAAESREQLIAVRYFFAHKNDGELLFGEYATGEAWSQARCGVRYDYVCRCLNPPAEQKLLKDVNETAQSSVSTKPKQKATDDLEELLAALPTDAAREKFMKKFDAQVEAEKVKNEEATQAALDAQEVELTRKRADAEAETTRIHDQEVADLRNALRNKAAAKSNLPEPTATALADAVALDEAILIIQQLVFNVIDKLALKNKKYFKQAVEFLKAHNAFREPPTEPTPPKKSAAQLDAEQLDAELYAAHPGLRQ